MSDLDICPQCDQPHPGCVGHTKNGARAGQPCGRPAIKGGTVCRHHGGAAPQVQAAAQRRLLEAADRVAAELVRLATKAESESVRVQASREVLDRAGLSARMILEATVTHHDGDGAFDARIEKLLSTMAERERDDERSADRVA